MWWIVVLIIALLADTVWVYLLWLAIGGLIIASEDFMKFIVAVSKTHYNRVPETIASLRSATPSEVKKKRDEEIEEILMTSSEENTTKDVKWIYVEVESLIHAYYEERYGERYKKNIKITNPRWSMIVDWWIMSKTNPEIIHWKDAVQSRNDLWFDYIVEIKYFRNKATILVSLKAALEKISFNGYITIWRLAIVVDRIDKKYAKSLLSDILNYLPNRPDITYDIFCYDGKWIELLVTSKDTR